MSETLFRATGGSLVPERAVPQRHRVILCRDLGRACPWHDSGYKGVAPQKKKEVTIMPYLAHFIMTLVPLKSGQPLTLQTHAAPLGVGKRCAVLKHLFTRGRID